MRTWTAQHIEAAKAILARHRTVREALGEIGAAVGFAVTPDAITGAMRRVGTTPREWVGGKARSMDVAHGRHPILPEALREQPRVSSPRQPPRPSPRQDFRAYAVISDVHVPFHCPRAHAAFCDFLRDIKPHGLIINGDFLDLMEISRHSAGSMAQLEGRRVYETFEVANQVLDEYQEAAGPQCQDLRYLDGNHEDRVRRWLASGDHGVWQGDESVSIEVRLRLRQRGFVYHEGDDSAFKLGHLLITHGRYTNRYHANKHLDVNRCSVAYGHVHSPQVMYGSAWDSQQVAIGNGHMADVDSPAMSYARKPNAWCQGFLVVWSFPDGTFNYQQINLWRSSFVYGGKLYGGRS